MTRATAAAERGRHVYSVILPTYNERENIPLIVCLISRGFEDACVHLVSVACPPVLRVMRAADTRSCRGVGWRTAGASLHSSLWHSDPARYAPLCAAASITEPRTRVLTYCPHAAA